MKVESLEIQKFIQLSKKHVVFDVRSPAEYAHAHFPKAVSLPLFSNAERKEIGTAYKQINKEEAIKIGLTYFGPKMNAIVERVAQELDNANNRTVLLHCWRGGMRSEAVAWLLGFYGFEVFVLEGGYKMYRNWVLREFSKPHKLRILSGFTGSGKTEILHELERLNHAVIDLEELAHHKGSAFGGIGMPAQPSNEQFENNLALQLFSYTENNKEAPIWLESESSRIGNVANNHIFFNQMKKAERIHIDIDKKKRLEKIIREYGVLNKVDLLNAVKRIQKRLGGAATKKVCNFIQNYDLNHAFDILLSYYDKGYKKSQLFQPPFLEVHLPNTDPESNTQIILEEISKYKCQQIK